MNPQNEVIYIEQICIFFLQCILVRFETPVDGRREMLLVSPIVRPFLIHQDKFLDHANGICHSPFVLLLYFHE